MYTIQVQVLSPERSSLFVSYCKPIDAVSSKTFARGTLVTLKAAGIDTEQWKAHSTRSASSRHQRQQLSCAELLKLADWSASGPSTESFTSDIFESFKRVIYDLCCYLFILNLISVALYLSQTDEINVLI